ncbi:MAG: response regulator [Pseudohongiellaceae bacterium]
MSASDHKPPAGNDQPDGVSALAREFNSLLTVLLGNAERLRDLAEPDSRIRELADSSVEAAHRSIALTRQLVMVSGSPPLPGEGRAPVVNDGELALPPLQHSLRRILLVEDDDLLRDFVITILESLDYQVVPAENGPHALALLDEYRDFDLLFTDIVMPGDIDGLELARRARQLMPELAVLLTSGYHEQLESGTLADIHRIHKPYRQDELDAALRQCFAAARSVEEAE